MTGVVASFYDGLADEYHLLFADWDASVRRQGEILDRLIVGQLGPPRRVLDCSCGIGTQAIGLAGRGYRVHGTDISPSAVERAQREAARLGVPLSTEVADLRALDAVLIEKPPADLPRVFDRPDGRQIAFQIWDWDASSPIYTVHQYIVREAGGAWQTHHEATVYRALQRAELTAIVREAGCRDVQWHLHEETGYYQPILTGRRVASGE